MLLNFSRGCAALIRKPTVSSFSHMGAMSGIYRYTHIPGKRRAHYSSLYVLSLSIIYPELATFIDIDVLCEILAPYTVEIW